MTGRAELFRALGALCERPRPEHGELTRALRLPEAPAGDVHTDLFLFQLFPYASVYVGAEGMVGGEASDRVAGFWRALGLEAPCEPDHLAALLALYAELIVQEQSASNAARRKLLKNARKALLWEHLMSWLPVYLDKLADIADAFFSAWGKLAGASLADEARRLGPPDHMPLHLREAPKVLVSPHSREEFFSWLLAPVCSGMVLCRSDLRRAAEELGLGLRVGERRFALESLLCQDAEGVLTWLAGEARRCTTRHGRWAPMTGCVSSFWMSRAEAAEALLVECTPRQVVVGA